MTCPKCKKDTTVLVTTEARRRVRERRGIVTTILFFPFRLVRGLFRIMFGRKQTYHRKQHWHCNYCNHDWKPVTE
ncbi:MAG: hypothetical protein FWC00_03270 [Firmicutes bacterium]|nr:hypothetical protein [Bacillota bacterium]